MDLFPPQELKSIEIDIDKKIFRLNGKDFGRGTKSFAISCTAESPDNWWEIRVNLDQRIRYVSYNRDGIKTADQTFSQT